MDFVQFAMRKKIIIQIGIAAICLAVAAIVFFIFFQDNKENNDLREFSLYDSADDSNNIKEIRPGFIYSDTWLPLEGAVVLADNKKFVVDKEGAWNTAGLESGTEITILAYGYNPYKGPYDPASPLVLNSLPSTDISVHIFDEQDGQVSDVFVILLDSNTREPKEILKSDGSGNAIFKNAPTGDSIIFAIKKGYRLGWKIDRIDEKQNSFVMVLKKREKPNQSMAQQSKKFRFIEEVHAQDAGEEFEQAFPDEYRLMIERDDNATSVEGIELSPDDVADELTNDPEKKDWKSLGAEKLEFSDDIPEGYRLERKMIEGKEVFVVESDVYTDSVMQRMFGMGVDYGELSVEAEARRKLAAESGGRPSFGISLYWNWDKMGSDRYIKSLYDTTEQPVNSSYSVVMLDGGMTQPATLYDSKGNPVTTPELLQEFLQAAKQIHKGNPEFSVTVNGSKEPTVVVGVPFTIEANITLNHEPVPGWYILSPAAIWGNFQSRWINNPGQKFQGPGKIMPYLLQNTPPPSTQFTNTYVERQEFTCLELGEETITYSFEVAYRFAQKTKDPRGLVEPGSSRYTYRVPLTIRCVGPELISRKAPDKCGNPADAVISGRAGGQHMDILESIEVYMTKDEAGVIGSVYGSINENGAFEVSTPLLPGFYYYWVFGHTTNGHVYLLDDLEGTIEIKEKEEGKEGCDDDEDEGDEQSLKIPIKTPPPTGGSSVCDGGGGWVCSR